MVVAVAKWLLIRVQIICEGGWVIGAPEGIAKVAFNICFNF